jgi:hypothetical protein
MSSIDFPFRLGIPGSDFPLSGSPYWSRTSYFEINQFPSEPKNYVFVGFKPGLPLQASELNEIQERAALENTLTSTMISSWPHSVPNLPEGVILYGPGWKGTTPLYPEPNFGDVSTDSTLFYKEATKLIANSGWYLVHVPSSNMKHWFYLSETKEITIPDNFTGFVGFDDVGYQIVKSSDDPALYDNSSGTTNITTGAPAGANRIKLLVGGLSLKISLDPIENFSPIAKINSINDILFMNNYPVSE